MSRIDFDPEPWFAISPLAEWSCFGAARSAPSNGRPDLHTFGAERTQDRVVVETQLLPNLAA